MRTSAVLVGVAHLAHILWAFQPPELEPRQMDCPTNAIDEVHATTVYVTVTDINTYIESNTVFQLPGNAVITIDNAPTLLTTTVFVTSTYVATVTVPTTVGIGPSSSSSTTIGGTFAAIASPSPSSTLPQAFVLMTVNRSFRRIRRRQGGPSVGGYAQGSGLTPTCREATIFVLIDGELYGGGELVGTNPNISYDPFLTSGVGNITTTFSVYRDILSWNNPSFFGGAAEFCVSPSGILNVVFDRRYPPADCGYIGLQVIPYSKCPNSTNTLSPAPSFPINNGTITGPTAGPTASAFPLPTSNGTSFSEPSLSPTITANSTNITSDSTATLITTTEAFNSTSIPPVQADNTTSNLFPTTT